VLATVSDRKLISTSSFYLADIVSLQDYYAFGMEMPDRTYNANAYKYSINGQEKDTDIEANHTTALYWEYDSRIGRRWNIDPKPHESISPFSCFGNNPIAFSDMLGDTLIVGDTQQSKDDIKSLADKTNQNYIKISDKNQVTLDFGAMNQPDINKALKKDEGLKLIKDIVDAKEKMLYEADFVALITNDKGDKVQNPLLKGHGITNASNGGTDSNGGHRDRPKAGFDGQVVINPTAQFEEDDGYNNSIPKARNTVVFHELAENYERTHNKVNYNGLNGAHELAKRRESAWNRGSNKPGDLSAQPILTKPTSSEMLQMQNKVKKYMGWK
jgi:hypothetical protein